MQIVEQVKKKIVSGELQPGEILPKELDYAKEFGVARPTLRNAFDVLEKEGFIIRKRSAGTVIAPQALHNKHLHADLAIVTKMELTDKSTYIQLFEDTRELGHVTRVAASKGMMMRFIPLHHESNYYDFEEIILRKGIDGFIISSPMYFTDFLDKLAEHKVPHVALETQYDRPGINTVMSDDEYSAIELLKQLYECGHRRIGYCGGTLKAEKFQSSNRRCLNIFLKFCKEYGITVKDHWIQNTYPNAWRNMQSDTRELAKEVLKNKNDLPTAVFTPTCGSAKGFWSVAGEQNIKLPQDISLVCNHIFESQVLELGITGYCKKLDQIGQTAFDSLMEWLRNPTYRPHCEKILPEKIVGKTVAPIKSISIK
jgi:DNA-binding LacI/PurR family transcriptional regulator